MNVILEVGFAIVGCVFLFITAYLLLLAVAAMIPEKRLGSASKTHRFAIVIPAHNESRILGTTLASIRELDYPGELVDVFVIADNCTDRTASVAKKGNVHSLVRHDPDHWGKGYALDWGFSQILTAGHHEAFVVIDADTIVDSGFLQAVNRRLCEGARVVQGYYDVQHPSSSPVESLSYLGFVARRLLRHRGRSKLGWSSNLLGNGMCFAREILERFGWRTTSIVEDVEFGMLLQLEGVRVVFAEDAKVYAEIPSTFAGAANQRGRWDLGKLRVARKFLFRLIREFFRRRDFSCLDAAMELLIPPFPITISLMTAGFVGFWLWGYTGLTPSLFIWLAVALNMGVYIFMCLITAQAGFKVYLSLLYAPYFVVWRLYLMIRGAIQGKHKRRVQTQRENRQE